MFISAKTVENHTRNILGKLHLSRKQELMRYALEHGIEVAFDAIQKSARHKYGYALRFPRIVRLRPDRLPSDINTLQDVAALFSSLTTPRDTSA